MSSDLQEDQYKDLVNYHTALKQFLSVSNAPNKPNPKRAAKAREKLLKLSATQFYELSTDVYDELERRIDESRDEPDFLLPKDNFHPKRNEAREKLGSLQQGRFKDLVSDILYEIERRNYHNYKALPQMNNQPTSPIINNDDQRISDNSQKNGVVGLQSTTVIPTKAELAWSSDEEDDNVSELRKSPENRSIHGRNQSRDLQFQPQSNRNSDSSLQQKHNSNVSDLDELSPQKKSSSSVSSSAAAANQSQVNRGLSISKGRNKDREIEMLIKEGTKMDETITQLEQKIALLQSKSDKFENEANDLKQINGNLNLKINDLENDLQQINLDKTDNSIINNNNNQFEKSLNNNNNTKEQNDYLNTDQKNFDKLKKEIIEWRSKFEDLKLQKIEDILSINKLITIKDDSIYLQNDGLIPISSVNSLYKAIESFLLFLNKDSKSLQKPKIDISLLFDQISNISSISGKISSFAPHSEKSEFVRASISHAITSTRYYALYSEFLPKLVLESAVSEIAFTICDLISDVKLTKDDSKFNTSEFNNVSNSNNITKNFSNGNDDEDLNEISPVRPLRMAKKSFEQSSNNNGSSSYTDANTAVTSATASLTSSKNSFNNKKNDNKIKNDINSTPRALNLTINSQSANNDYKKIQNVNKFDTTTTPSTSFSQQNVDSPSSMKNRDLNGSGNGSGSGTAITTPLRKSGLPSLVSRYSPESERKSQESTPTVSHLRKSSSSNILSKVRQFEQQGNDEMNTSPQRSVKSPFNDLKVGKLSPKRTSYDDAPMDSTTSSMKHLNGISKNISISKPNEETTTMTSSKLNEDLNNSIESKSRNIATTFGEESQIKNETDGRVMNEGNFNIVDEEEDDNDSTSVAQLRGAIQKNKDLHQISPQNNKDVSQSPISNGIINNLTSKFPNEEDDDLNELPVDSEFGTKSIMSNLNHNLSGGIQKHSLKERIIGAPLSTSSTSGKSISGNTSHTEPSNRTIGSFGNASNGGTLNSYTSSNPIDLDDDIEEMKNSKPAYISVPDYEDPEEKDDDEEEEEEEKKEDEKLSEKKHIDANDDLNELRDSKESNDSDEVASTNTSGAERRGRDLDEEFDVEQFDIDDPDNTLSELLLYLEHQTIEVISTIQSLLTSIKKPDSTKGELRFGSRAINSVVTQMVDATSVSMDQSRNKQLKEHGIWVVQSLKDSGRRMDTLCNLSSKDGENENDDEEYAEKHFKQRLAGIAFDVAKCTKELVKTVEEANLKEEIAHLDAKISS